MKKGKLLEKMDIRNDDSILSIYRKCESCFDVYDATDDVEIITKALCENCNSQKIRKKCFKTLPSSGYSSLLPYQIPQVREVLKNIFPEPPSVIVDASAHIGGDTIHFAKLWPLCRITSIDIDENAVKCLKENVETFVPNNNVEIICADSTLWIISEKRLADFYYFDPPWGGPDYCSEEEVSLCLSGKPVVDLINFVLDQKLAPKVILKAPRNFAYPTFKKEVHGVTKLHYIRKPQKRGSIAYALILIWKE